MVSGKPLTLRHENNDLMEEKKQKRQLNIELPEEVAEGVYSNMAMINHSPTEFVLDFIRMMPNMPKAKVKSRVILTPQHAKSLLKVLNEGFKPDVIWWMPDGNGFAYNVETVQEDFLDKCFKGTKLTSFVRSLNRW